MKPQPIRYTATSVASLVVTVASLTLNLLDPAIVFLALFLITGYIAVGEWQAKFKRDASKPQFRPTTKWSDADGRKQP